MRGPLGGQLDRPPVDVHVAPPLGEPVRDRERRVVQGAGESVAELPWRAGVPELDDEVGHRAAREPAAEEIHRERERHGGDDEVGDDVDRPELLVGRPGEDADRRGDSRRGAGPEDDRERAPPARGRVAPALREDREDGEEERDPDEAGGVLERVGERVVRVDEREVPRIAGLAVVEEDPDPDQHGRVEVPGDHDRP